MKGNKAFTIGCSLAAGAIGFGALATFSNRCNTYVSNLFNKNKKSNEEVVSQIPPKSKAPTRGEKAPSLSSEGGDREVEGNLSSTQLDQTGRTPSEGSLGNESNDGGDLAPTPPFTHGRPDAEEEVLETGSVGEHPQHVSDHEEEERKVRSSERNNDNDDGVGDSTFTEEFVEGKHLHHRVPEQTLREGQVVGTPSPSSNVQEQRGKESNSTKTTPAALQQTAAAQAASMQPDPSLERRRQEIDELIAALRNKDPQAAGSLMRMASDEEVAGRINLELGKYNREVCNDFPSMVHYLKKAIEQGHDKVARRWALHYLKTATERAYIDNPSSRCLEEASLLLARDAKEQGLAEDAIKYYKKAIELCESDLGDTEVIGNLLKELKEVIRLIPASEGENQFYICQKLLAHRLPGAIEPLINAFKSGFKADYSALRLDGETALAFANFLRGKENKNDQDFLNEVFFFHKASQLLVIECVIKSITKDDRGAFKEFETSAEQARNKKLLYECGQLCEKYHPSSYGSMHTVCGYYREAAKAGRQEALDRLLQLEKDSPRPTIHLALVYEHKSQNSEDPELLRQAIHFSAKSARSPGGDNAQGVVVLKRYAEKENAEALFHLGQIYNDGTSDIPKDTGMAKTYFGRAAAQGHQEAARILEPNA
jgi:TPR repeat protein